MKTLKVMENYVRDYYNLAGDLVELLITVIILYVLSILQFNA